MTQESKNSSNAGHGESGPNHPIVTAINAFGEKYEAFQRDRPEHDRQTLLWTKRAVIGAGLYTLLTLVLAVLGYCALRTAQEQVAVSRDTEKRQLRAYVFIDQVDFVIDERTLIAKLFLKNSGQTPAYHFQVWQRMKTQPANEEFSYLAPSTQKIKIDTSILGPGVVVTPRVTLEVPTNNSVVLPAMQNGTAMAYVYGKLRYRDAFDDSWCLDFRLRSGKPNGRGVISEMRSAPQGNSERNDYCPDWLDHR